MNEWQHVFYVEYLVARGTKARKQLLPFSKKPGPHGEMGESAILLTLTPRKAAAIRGHPQIFF